MKYWSHAGGKFTGQGNFLWRGLGVLCFSIQLKGSGPSQHWWVGDCGGRGGGCGGCGGAWWGAVSFYVYCDMYYIAVSAGASLNTHYTAYVYIVDNIEGEPKLPSPKPKPS